MMFSSFCGCQNNVSVHYSLETRPVFNATLGTLHFKMHILNKGFTPQALFNSILCLFYPLEICSCACKPLISTSDHNQPMEKTKTLPSLFWVKAGLGIQGSPCVLTHSWH